MASTSAFGQTLQYITSIKLLELERQRTACATYVGDTLSEASNAVDAITRFDILVKRIGDWNGLGDLLPSSSVSLSSYQSWLHQAKNDPSISASQVEAWSSSLETQLRQATTRYDFAKLFGDLLDEWLKSGDSLTTAAPEVGTQQPVDTGIKATREERVIQQDRIAELIFEAKPTDTKAISAYLEELFSGPDASNALDSLRRTVRNFGDTLLKMTVDESGVKDLIRSLLSRDLLSPEKTATIKGFLGSDVIIQEVASVLNMQLASLDTWAWPQAGVQVHMRRHLSGKYRAYMDNEIMQALLFQYIGMQWSVALKSAFHAVVISRAWKRETPPLSREQLKRRQTFLNEHKNAQAGRGRGGYRGRVSRGWSNSTGGSGGSIEASRTELQHDKFFLTQLPSDISVETPYDEEPQNGEKPNQGVNAQQVLLRLVSTETNLKRALHGHCTVVRADLEWFGPSLPHDSILAVFEFFGVPKLWLTFFRKWLAAPLVFAPDVEPKTRARGVPIAHALSVLCGEAVLFGMDFAVNQRANGLYLYRIYDDFWYYSHDTTATVAAWAEMGKYADLVGISFNKKKTGSVCVGSEPHPSLPAGVVGWGFLVFDSAEGRFVVDQAQVDTHIAELRRQLAAAKSVFGYVNALNKYLEFFRRNFGQPSHCFGRVHADEIVATFARIYRQVFSETNGSMVKSIQTMVQSRFGVKDVPAGWCFIPAAEGGLGVVNPIVDLLTVRKDLPDDPSDAFRVQMKQDLVVYQSLESSWLSGAGEGSDKNFIPFEEYILGRETVLGTWGDVWHNLQEVAEASYIEPVTEDSNWHSRSDTEKWTTAVYADEIKARFGALKIVEPTLIPVGMLSAFRSAKIAWDS